MMDNIFWDMKAKEWIIIYMNNIFIFIKELQQNIKYTKWTLQQLKKTTSIWNQRDGQRWNTWDWSSKKTTYQ